MFKNKIFNKRIIKYMIREILNLSKLIYHITRYYSSYYIYKQYDIQLKDNIINCIQQNGCVFIKISQWISTKLETIYNSVDDPLILGLGNFYENCQTHDFAHTKNILESHFKKPINEIFSEFIEEPVASGSIGQVYIGILRQNNKKVAVKIKHPNIDNQCIQTAKLLRIVLKLIRLPFETTSFFKELEQQLNFKTEVSNILKVQQIYPDRDMFIIPHVYMYSDEFIISEFINCVNFDECNKQLSGYDKKKVSILLYIFMFDSTLIKNFSHGDMHIGNWKIKKVKNSYKIVVFDWGLVHVSDNITLSQEIWSAVEEKKLEDLLDLIFQKIHYSPYTNKQLEDIKHEFLDKNDDITNEFNTNFFSHVFIFLMNKGIILKSDVFHSILTIIFMEKVFLTNVTIDNENRDLNLWFETLREIKISIISEVSENKIFADLTKLMIKTLPSPINNKDCLIDKFLENASSDEEDN
jgi:predicted unusual protein kinase regulating ubiquinone biosynthesis (AarF/ABC1/UbiB family)